MRDGLRELFTILGQESAGSGRLNIGLEISREANLFAIHFPKMPIVPGACLLGLVLDRVEAWQGIAYHVAAMSRISFGFPVTPGTTLQLELRLDASTADNQSTLVFRYAAVDGRSTHGTLNLVQRTMEAT